MSKTKIRIIIAVAVVFILTAGILARFGAEKYEEYYNATYLKIDGVQHRRDTVSLDLSGDTIRELEKIKELTALEELNLRNTGITAEQYDDLQAALPNCRILWSVPFQGAFYDNDATELTVSSLSAADVDTLDYLPELKTVNAENCRDYAQLVELIARHPDADVTYFVELAGTAYQPSQQALEFTDPNVDELLSTLKYLPKVESVVLDGELPDNDTLFQLFDAYPNVKFDCDLDVWGMTLNTMIESVDLSGKKFSGTEAVESLLPYFPNLNYVEMCGCGISNADMDSMNRRHEDVRFIWTVEVSGVTVRTDIKHFMPYLFDMKKVGNCYNLRYCTDVVAMDFGHYAIKDLSFLEYMPKLEFLLLCQDPITDASVIANCTSLKYLELFLTKITDFWPLTNLTNLDDLNLCYSPSITWKEFGKFGDVTPLYHMPWLDRLWIAHCEMNRKDRAALSAALPGTTIIFEAYGSTTAGWRHSPNYYEQRDILGLWYMIA